MEIKQSKHDFFLLYCSTHAPHVGTVEKIDKSCTQRKREVVPKINIADTAWKKQKNKETKYTPALLKGYLIKLLFRVLMGLFCLKVAGTIQTQWQKMKKETVSVYSKDSLMPNTILTLMYNIIKVKRRDTLKQGTNDVFMYNQLPGTSCGFHIKHSKYKNKNSSNKLFQDCL